MRERQLAAPLVVVGGGMAGCLAAVRAARDGITTVLVQDRPVLGGNASKEIGVPALGAGGGQNNAYFRETGLLEELLLNNLARNPCGLLEYWDASLLDFVLGTPNLTLLLNTPVIAVTMADEQRIAAVHAYTLGAEIRTTITGEYFIDASGDGMLGALAGAPFRQGREARAEFNEPNAPAEASAETMGATITFWGRDLGRPVPFVAPNFARKLQEEDFKSGRHPLLYFRDDGNVYGDWWIESGHHLDQVYDAERIRFNALALAYGVWDYLKNRHPQREKLARYALAWVSTIAGKRESRRFEGDYLFTENDVLAQRLFPDGVAFGGWSLDDHAEGGFDNDGPGTIFLHIPGTYQIPLRSLYSRTIVNLFFAGRNVSVTHRALSSTRLINTCGQLGEAVGRAAAVCLNEGVTPRQLATGPAVAALQQSLLLDDHHIPGVALRHPDDLAPRAAVTASSCLPSPVLEETDSVYPLTTSFLQRLPVQERLETVAFFLDAEQGIELPYRVWLGDAKGNYFPEQCVFQGRVTVPAGTGQWVAFPAPLILDHPQWVFLELAAAAGVTLRTSRRKLVGVASYQPCPRRLASAGERPYDFINDYSDWVRLNDIWATRHQSACFRLGPAQASYAPENVTDGYLRPHCAPRLWISAPMADAPEWVQLTWPEPVTLREVRLLFDTDLDFFLRPIRAEYPFSRFPECVRDYRLEARAGQEWRTITTVRDNYQRLRCHTMDDQPIDALRLVVEATNGGPEARVYGIIALQHQAAHGATR